MTVHIDGVRVGILAVSLVVGYFVYKHSVAGHPGPAGTGDIVGAIASAAAVGVLLWTLFGGDASNSVTTPDRPSVTAPQSTESPSDSTPTPPAPKPTG